MTDPTNDQGVPPVPPAPPASGDQAPVTPAPVTPPPAYTPPSTPPAYTAPQSSTPETPAAPEAPPAYGQPAAYGAPAAYGQPNPGQPGYPQQGNAQPGYAQPGYAQPGYAPTYSAVPPSAPKTLSLIGMILGILGVLGFAVVFLPIVGSILGLFFPAAAVVLGFMGRTREGAPAKGLWMTALITGFIGVGIALIALVGWIALFAVDSSGY